MQDRVSRRAVTSSFVAGSLLAAVPGKSLAQDATPVPGGLDLALEQLPGVITEMMAATGVPGVAVGVVHNDEVVYVQGFGEREVGTGQAVGPDTVFQIASVSKPLSSTVVAAAVGDQHVSWDTKLAAILPEFRLSDPWVTANVTIADLFSHRSGLPDHAGDDLEDLGGTREQVLAALQFIELEGEFRDSYAYTNFGLTAAAEGVARVIGAEWHEVGQQLLFGPAGMSNTSYLYSDFAANEDRAVGHVLQDGEWVYAFDRQPDAQSAAGGVSSSVRDLSQWMRLQLREGVLDGAKLVDKNALGETHLPQAMIGLRDESFSKFPGHYGLGWNVSYDETGTVTLNHSGAFLSGAATVVMLWPSEDLGLVVLTNGSPMGLPESIGLTFHDLVRYGAPMVDYLPELQAYFAAAMELPYGQDVLESPTDPEPALDAAAYTGTYLNDVFGPLDITVEGEDLLMTLGPIGMQFPLTHFNRDVFTFEPVGENAGRASAVTFTVSADGTASRVVLENLDIYHAGTFVRATEQTE